MNNKTKKWIFISLGVVVALLVVFGLLGKYNVKINLFFEGIVQQKIYDQMKAKSDALLEAQKKDDIGGKTPEETLELYIAALKMGDINLASKYWAISPEAGMGDLQAKELESLKGVIMRDGNLDLVIKNNIDILEKGKKNVWSETDVSFVYYFITDKELVSTSTVSRDIVVTVIPKGTRLDVGLALKLNPYTNVWKIIQ